MSSPAKAHEPTMEEILASIRRIISDDEPGTAKPSPSHKAAAEAPPVTPFQAPKPVPAAAEPELAAPDLGQPDLGQDDIDAMFAAMDGPAAAPAAMAPPPPIDLKDDLDVLELTEDLADEPAPPAPVAPPRASAPLREAVAQAATDRLLSPKADESVQAAFGSLASTIMAGSARTLDDIVSEMLRPMLKTWLDDNLPPLVERLVRQEIERVARGGR